METKTITCDRCRKEINANESVFKISMVRKDRAIGPYTVMSQFEGKDLCNECGPMIYTLVLPGNTDKAFVKSLFDKAKKNLTP